MGKPNGKFNVLAEARGVQYNRGGRKCRLCYFPPNEEVDPPLAIEALWLLLERRQRGDLEISYPGIVEILNRAYPGLALTTAMVGRHSRTNERHP